MPFSIASIIRLVIFAFAIVFLPGVISAFAGESGVDVQRLQVQREHQQMELRLKMQQQHDRALRPAPDASTDLRRSQLERDQQQRQQQLFDEQRRAAINPNANASDDAVSDRARADAARLREAQSAAEQARRFEAERQ